MRRCKKIRQRLAYFGPWDDPDADTSKELTVYLLSGRFLTLKKARLETGKLGQRMYRRLRHRLQAPHQG